MSPELRRIGILGGTFDPIHVGHLDLANAAALTLNLQRLFFVVSNVPPHRAPPFASPFHRFAMVSIAVSGRPGWEASDLELQSSSPSYTTTTLTRFLDRGFKPSELFFVIGADAFAEIATWRDYPAILDAAHFAVVSRPGTPAASLPKRLPALASRMIAPSVVQSGSERALAAPKATSSVSGIILIDAATADVAATAIRARSAQGQSIAGLVPAGVQQHIEQHGLYRTNSPELREADRATTVPAGRLHGQN